MKIIKTLIILLLITQVCFAGQLERPNDTPTFHIYEEEIEDAYVEMWVDKNNVFQVKLHNCTMTEAAQIFIEYIKNNW